MMQLSYSYFCRKKFAAMFGLDARIALAIFGALSIITGAALYNVLEQSKATTLLAELNETGKAIEQYYLHTRKMPSRWSSDSSSHEFYNYKLVDLVKAPNPTVKGWKGPYLPYGVHSNNNDLNNKRIDADNHLGAFLLEQNPVFGDMTMWTNALCTAGKKCNLWLYSSHTSDAEFRILDKKIDKGDGPTSGNVRAIAYWIYLKYMPVQNPN